MVRAKRRRRDRSVLPVLSMFLFGLFLVLGASPGSLIFDSALSFVSPYLQVAFILVLILAIYILYDQVIVPLQQLIHAFRWGGVLAIVSLVLAFLGGFYLLVSEMGIVFFLISLLLWKLTVYLSYKKRRW
ncbi:MAG: hypothetical protein MIO90_05450 [Methanomassiliicoccales archaeon]|nr:hypothetical protein [Methanomassiliicoccales archaeon]